ncbi:unnamed protein product [Prorocentrum cordatum]|uniref:Uncharacterized protein n=1 Tax=Prorocentrum cordatum TaxID=2364126 RepID=A0ABN9Y515_9DINO|nr:unnamed protein product [Polarella glacialis]
MRRRCGAALAAAAAAAAVVALSPAVRPAVAREAAPAPEAAAWRRGLREGEGADPRRLAEDGAPGCGCEGQTTSAAEAEAVDVDATTTGAPSDGAETTVAADCSCDSPAPSAAPTALPTAAPTALPTAAPTAAPTAGPSAGPTAAPTAAPTPSPTWSPAEAPTVSGSLTVSGLDYADLVNDADLKADFEGAVTSGVVQDVGGGVVADDVDLTLSSGSVIVDFVVRVLSGDADTVASFLVVSNLGETVARELETAMAGYGSISVSFDPETVSISTGGMASTTEAPLETTGGTPDESSSDGLSGGVIAVIVIAVVVFIGGAIAIAAALVHARRPDLLSGLLPGLVRADGQPRSRRGPGCLLRDGESLTKRSEVDTLDDEVKQLELDVQKVAAHIDMYSSRFAESSEDPPAALVEQHDAFLLQWRRVSDSWTRFLSKTYLPEHQRRRHILSQRDREGPDKKGKRQRGQRDDADGGAEEALTSPEEVAAQQQQVDSHIKDLERLLASYGELLDSAFPGEDISLGMDLPQRLLGGLALGLAESETTAEVALLRQFVDVLLEHVEVKPYGVLGVPEGRSEPKPLAPLEAVVVDVVEAHVLGRDGPGAAGEVPRSIYRWLDLGVTNGDNNADTNFPKAVAEHFKVSGKQSRHVADETSRPAKLHAYRPGQTVIHGAAPALSDTHTAVRDLSGLYRETLLEFCAWLEESGASSSAWASDAGDILEAGHGEPAPEPAARGASAAAVAAEQAGGGQPIAALAPRREFAHARTPIEL